ncbi:MAG TPA: endonuclease V [Candidatus Dormibacteraeota bacterium]
MLVERWPRASEELEALQHELAMLEPPPWRPAGAYRVGAVFACGPRGSSGAGEAGQPGWAAAVLGADWAVVSGRLAASYQPGLLALREGELLERAVRALAELPDVLLVDATGRDHPRRAGLALHLGWAVGLPTVGVTRRLLHDGEGAQRTSEGLWVHAAWRTDLETALAVVRSVSGRVRTPAPLREARRLARTARSYA